MKEKKDYVNLGETFAHYDDIDTGIEDKKKKSASKKPRITTTVEINPMNKLNNLTKLRHLEPISEHLWWLALFAKISIGMLILSLIGAILLGT
tara:strand:- start:699 stop:977 length:279 start_codon:yes stop_codon:yes gene_type:complete